MSKKKRIRRLRDCLESLEMRARNQARLLEEAREGIYKLEDANANLRVEVEAADVLLGEAMDRRLGG